MARYHNTPVYLGMIAAYSSFGSALFGALGLLAINRRPDNNGDIRLYLMVLILDCLALCFNISAPTVSSRVYAKGTDTGVLTTRRS